MASGWKIIVQWFLPPPLILTALLILPMPEVIRKGLLKFVRHFLFYQIAGPYKLVHVALMVTGILLAACGVSTYNLANSQLPETLTPNQRTAILARRWREERNFWIAALCFLLWGLLFRFYQRELEHMELRDRYKREVSVSRVASGSGGTAGGKATHAKGAAPLPTPAVAAAGKGAAVEPTAPPAPPDMMMEGEAKKTK